MDLRTLNEKFTKGSPPADLNGFYTGKLLLLLPKTLPEHLANLLRHMYVPWIGKCFYHSLQSGDNILPSLTKPALTIYPRKIIIGVGGYGGFHAFPFTTSITTGFDKSTRVLKLRYDLPENPPRIRTIIDELVSINEHLLLGRIYLKEKETFRPLGFFHLRK